MSQPGPGRSPLVANCAAFIPSTRRGSMTRRWLRRLLGSCIAITACLVLPLAVDASFGQRAPAHPAQAASTSPAPFTRGAYGKRQHKACGDMAATGFNTVMTGPYPEQLGKVAAMGMKGVVW